MSAINLINGLRRHVQVQDQDGLRPFELGYRYAPLFWLSVLALFCFIDADAWNCLEILGHREYAEHPTVGHPFSFYTFLPSLHSILFQTLLKWIVDAVPEN